MDFRKFSGAILMCCFGVFSLWKWHQTSLIFYLLLVFRNFLAAYFFMVRTYAKPSTGIKDSSISFLSTALPLFYLESADNSDVLSLISNLLCAFGFLIVVLATIELGKSFGVTAAKRNLVETGIYRLFPHPMYAGYIIAELGFIFINQKNIGIFLFSISLYLFRANTENKILRG